jgi:hypothetical protein
VKKKWRLWSVIFPLFASETRLSFLRSRVLTKKKKKKTRTRRSLSRARFNELLSLLRSQSARIRVDLFFPRAKKRRKARVDLREREVSLSLLCAKHRTKLSVPANLLFFRRKKSFQYMVPTEKSRISRCASVETRANEKNETRRRGTSRRTFFYANKKFVARKRLFSRGVCVRAIL